MHWLELLLSVSYRHRYHMILVHPIPQHAFELTQTGTLPKGKDALVCDNQYPPNGSNHKD